jgi:hypothetical protein
MSDQYPDASDWELDRELDVAAEVYGPPTSLNSDADDEELLERFRTLLGFDVRWE